MCVYLDSGRKLLFPVVPSPTPRLALLFHNITLFTSNGADTCSCNMQAGSCGKDATATGRRYSLLLSPKSLRPTSETRAPATCNQPRVVQKQDRTFLATSQPTGPVKWCSGCARALNSCNGASYGISVSVVHSNTPSPCSRPKEGVKRKEEFTVTFRSSIPSIHSSVFIARRAAVPRCRHSG
jgi:hypothetical protein